MPLLTRLALLILAGAGVLAALGCGGAGGDKTIEGDGYSFSYPGDWDEGTARQEGAASGRSNAAVSPPGSEESFVSSADAHRVCDLTAEDFADRGVLIFRCIDEAQAEREVNALRAAWESENGIPPGRG